MEVSLATVVPAIVAVIVFFLIILLVNKVINLTYQTIGWMVLNGHWFPKIMRTDREMQILRTQRHNSHIDLLTRKIEDAHTQEEVNEYYRQLIELKEEK